MSLVVVLQELQDRIDELQAQLQEFHSLGRAPQLCSKSSLLDELESKSPGMESDPGNTSNTDARDSYFYILFI